MHSFANHLIAQTFIIKNSEEYYSWSSPWSFLEGFHCDDCLRILASSSDPHGWFDCDDTKYRSLAYCYRQFFLEFHFIFSYCPIVYLAQALTILKHKEPHESFTCMASSLQRGLVYIDSKLEHMCSIYNRGLHLPPNHQYYTLPGEVMLSYLRENVPTWNQK